jgi:large subunit ribosomal protein L23e
MFFLLHTAGKGQVVGSKFRVTVSLPVGAVLNCADNTGAKNLYVIAVKGYHGRLNRLPTAGVGDMIICTVKKGKPELRKKGVYLFVALFDVLWMVCVFICFVNTCSLVTTAVVIRQSKPWRRMDGTFLYFEGMMNNLTTPPSSSFSFH